ncbi:endothelial PAS domain-containing protein 1-like [Actinia tenebrosa]|uniref:Endothelial PAS domain-containing protein 1-like n=1 Tax=Actinia tenebrosa TaxID=6105 RepID=A0A6P8IXK7_ACTTE|nr:endothelial PAS domain-containing protein 1-like [Actinia tenebrosa]
MFASKLESKMTSKAPTKNKEIQKKCKSRDAARSRRGQQNDEFIELSHQLPLPEAISGQLDRLCIMRLTNSYIKIKKLLNSMMNQDIRQVQQLSLRGSSVYDKQALEAMDGFLYVVAPDGQCLYISDNISHYMGLSQIEVTGNSLYKYVHPCDHEELANQLGGQIPLEDMEIFDGLFCSDSVFMMSNHLKKGSKKAKDINPHRSFFLRMKSTLTSRGKSVNLRASTYRVVHCTGSMKYTERIGADGKKENVPLFLVAIAVPLMFATTFEVPLDRGTFTSRHMLDMKFLQCDEKASNLLGYSQKELIGKSWYNFHHAADLDNVLMTHRLLLTKGQSVSKYYRFLARDGGWVWLQTKAHVVYDSKTCQPQFVFCINYVLGGKQRANLILSNEQNNPIPVAGGLKSILKTDNTLMKDNKNAIILDERTKLIKQTKAGTNKNQEGIKKEQLFGSCAVKQEKNKKFCDCLEVDCEHMNFQECFPVAWEDVIQQQEEYEQYTWDHYGEAPIDTPPMSPGSLDNDSPVTENDKASALLTADLEDSAPFLPSPSTDKHLMKIKEEKDDCSMKDEEEDDDDENLHGRAPFIPPPFTDTGLTCDDDMLTDVSFGDSSCWLDGSAIKSFYTSSGKLKRASQSLSSSPVSVRKVPDNIRRNGYITNDLVSTQRVLFPSVTQFDAEVNAPVQSCNLLQGDELLTALDQEMMDINQGYM